jgi:hypothetical protein
LPGVEHHWHDFDLHFLVTPQLENVALVG